MENELDYTPYIKKIEGKVEFFIEFTNAAKQKRRVHVTKEILLQFFGTHYHKAGSSQYFIIYENQELCITDEVSKIEYDAFQSFKSMQLREQNIYDRYIEHFELSEESLYQRSSKGQINIVDELYKKHLHKCLYDAVLRLPEVQRRRLTLRYIEGQTLAQIAQKEGCSIPAVKGSIDLAIKDLKKKLNKFSF